MTDLDTVQRRGLSRGDQAYRFIVEGIQSGRLAPGTRLRETELAEQTGLSRTPVREALSRLQLEGLATMDATRGLIITELDYSMASELYAMRETLEGTAARLAAQHASDVEIEFLRAINERHAQLVDTNALVANNRLFHETLYRCAHNRYLIKTLNTLQESLTLLGPTTLASTGRAETARREHETIVEALARRDPDAAEQAARAHIVAAYRIRLAQLFDAPSSGNTGTFSSTDQGSVAPDVDSTVGPPNNATPELKDPMEHEPAADTPASQDTPVHPLPRTRT